MAASSKLDEALMSIAQGDNLGQSEVCDSPCAFVDPATAAYPFHPDVLIRIGRSDLN